MAVHDITSFYSFSVPYNIIEQYSNKYNQGGEYVINFYEQGTTYDPGIHSGAYRGHYFSEIPPTGVNGNVPDLDYSGIILWKRQALGTSIVHPKTSTLTDKSRGARILGTDIMIKKRPGAVTSSLKLIVANHNALYGQTGVSTLVDLGGNSCSFQFDFSNAQGYGYTDIVNGALKSPIEKWLGAQVIIGYIKEVPLGSGVGVSERGNAGRLAIEGYREAIGIVTAVDGPAHRLSITVPNIYLMGGTMVEAPVVSDFQTVVCVAPDSQVIKLIDHGRFNASNPAQMTPIGEDLNPVMFSTSGANIYWGMSNDPYTQYIYCSKGYGTRLPVLKWDFGNETDAQLITVSVERKNTPEGYLFDAGIELMGISTA